MNFQKFVNAHLKWRADVTARKDQIDFDLETVRRDDLCEIGKWFHGPGHEQCGTRPEFVDAKQAHANFHSSVARSIEKTGLSGSDAEFEVLIKALKSLSDSISGDPECDFEPAKKNYSKEDVCVKGFKLAKAHAQNQSYELAQTVLGRLPCGDCELGGACTDMTEFMAQFKASHSV